MENGTCEIILIIKDEVFAEEFLRKKKKRLLKTFTHYPYCGNKPFGKVRRNVYNIRESEV